MSGQQRQTERGGGEQERGQKNAVSMLQPGFAGERQKNRETGREEEMGQRFAMQRRQTGLRDTVGAIRWPAGAGQHSAVFNQDRKAT